jgi:hypothetical protein
MGVRARIRGMQGETMMLYRIESAYAPEIPMVQSLFPDSVWMANAIGSAVCEVCHCINRSRFPEPFNCVVTGSVEEQAIAAIETLNVQMFRRDVIAALAEDMDHFSFGKVSFIDDDLHADFATCYCTDWITARGGPQSQYAVCPKCEAVLSHLGNSPEYILAADLAGHRVYQDAKCRLYLSRDLALRFDESRWEEVVLNPIPVHEEATL